MNSVQKNCVGDGTDQILCILPGGEGGVWGVWERAEGETACGNLTTFIPIAVFYDVTV